jgi:hypothetical protein
MEQVVVWYDGPGGAGRRGFLMSLLDKRKRLVTWRGPVAFGMLALVGAMGPDIVPSVYWPDLSHYIPRYVLLACSVGMGISCIRRGGRIDRLIGIAVVVVGLGMVAYIAKESLRKIARY